MNEWKKSKSRIHNVHRVEGEKPSKYFLSAEKQQINNNAMKVIMDENNKYCDYPVTMMQCSKILPKALY